MYKWLQKYNKRLLAVFAVFLMVAFLAPTTGGGCDPNNMAMGTMGANKVNAIDVQNALGEFEYVRRSIHLPQSGPNGEQQFVPLINATPLRAALPQLEEHRILYYLLREEARQMGATVSPEMLEDALARINIRLPDGRMVMYENMKDSAQGKGVRQALANVLSVSAAFNRARSDIKVTEPQRRTDLAMQYQAMKLRLVNFDGKSYDNTIAAPTPQQLNEQFQKYADVLPGEWNATDNPFGFGYKLPDRVTLQYIAIGRDQIRRAVLDNPQNGATPEDRAYYWEVEARKYYNANKETFATTQSSTQPTTAPSAQPFEAVKQAAIDQVIAPQIDRLARLVQQRIVTAMNNDYTNFAKVAPATAPATSLGAAYNTFDYLQALAGDIQKQFGVIPTLVNLGDPPRSTADLQKLDGIRDAGAMLQGRETPFAEYAVSSAEPLAPGAVSERDQAFLLKLYQPSQTMTDFADTVYIFRLTGADKTHKPTSIAEVKAQVESDLKTRLAYEAAVADAKQMLATAGVTDLATAAGTRPIIDTPDMRMGRPAEIPGLLITSDGQTNLMRQAFDLLAVDDNPNPRMVIELPREGRALLAELKDVRSDIPEQLMAMAEAQQASGVIAQMSQILAASWFNYYNVVDRVNYIEPGAKTPATQPAAER